MEKIDKHQTKRRRQFKTETARPEIIYSICLLALEKYLYMEGSKKLLFDMREIKEEKQINER